jgi:hypothetical protein
LNSLSKTTLTKEKNFWHALEVVFSSFFINFQKELEFLNKHQL